MSASVWQEKVRIPTYPIGEPEECPIFLEKRVYQGSSGVVYPHAVVESIGDDRFDREYVALFLENPYLKIMILPELGGRVQMAYDKIKERHFVYYNQVIKPALVGLTGPWVSGGIEFNWPQHHRPSTFLPIDHCLRENTNGSVSVLVSEIDRMHRTKALVAFTLYPDRAYLEVGVKLFNRTPCPQTFLWWANPAVHAGEHYQSVFPPDVHAVFDHGRRDVSTFPVATGTYYKVDYSAGVDISRYRNIPVPTSYMAVASRYDFVGGYEHDTQAGLLHVADHHVSPGKKQWTWGAGDFGKAWDRNLTDDDGPYVELMCGVYTDNQPDFSWLLPYEEKSFEQYFLPYRDVGAVKNATKEALVNLEVRETDVRVRAYAPSVYRGAHVHVACRGATLLDEAVDLAPTSSYDRRVTKPAGVKEHDLVVSVRDAHGRTLVEYSPDPRSEPETPEPARAAVAPEGVDSIEELYLTGLHLEQYRHATYDPTDYYREALRREPGDSRCNNALGLWLLRRGQLREAEGHFRTAIATLTGKNPNPYDGEAIYHLGLSLAYQNRPFEAIDALAKATWSAPVAGPAHYHLALLYCRSGDYRKALGHVQRALDTNVHQHAARVLKAALLRKLGKLDLAADCVDAALELDPFDLRALFERGLPSRSETSDEEIRQVSRGDVHTFIEHALDYMAAGLWPEARQLLRVHTAGRSSVYPMVYYLAAHAARLAGDEAAARRELALAAKAPLDHCFPNRLEECLALEAALELCPEDAHAHYLLGNLLYNYRRYDDAIRHFEEAVRLDETLALAHRNLALAYYNRCAEPDRARSELERAFALKPTARILMELDQLKKKQGVKYQERLAFLEQHSELVWQRDDLVLEKATLLNDLEQPEHALNLLMSRRFHPWEGGEGKVTGQYVFARLALGRKLFAEGDAAGAIEHFEAARSYPENLGEGKLAGASDNDVLYWLGRAYEATGNAALSCSCFQAATAGSIEPQAAESYNDQPPHQILYQGLSLSKLGLEAEAEARFKSLIDYARTHRDDHVAVDYFAVSLPDMLIFESDRTVLHRQHCAYLEGLGELGRGNHERAIGLLSSVVERDPYHQGAVLHLRLAEREQATERSA